MLTYGKLKELLELMTDPEGDSPLYGVEDVEAACPPAKHAQHEAVAENA